jgi:hypothetical protein
MLAGIGLAFGVISLAVGVVLLDGGNSNSDVSRVLGGAALIAFGATTIWLIVRSEMKWRRLYRIHRLR